MKSGFLLCLLISTGFSASVVAKAETTDLPQEPKVTQVANDSIFTPEEMAEAKELALTVPELRKFPANLKAKRRASIILAEYTELKDNKYTITINEEEAAKLGVVPELYKATVSEIEMTNKMVAEMLKNGQKIELPDIQAIVKAYKRGELTLPIVM